MSELKLSKQGQKLIKLYEQMAEEGYKRNDGIDVKNAFSDLEGQQKGYYNIVECDSDGRGDVTPIVDDNEDLKVTRCYYNGGKISE